MSARNPAPPDHVLRLRAASGAQTESICKVRHAQTRSFHVSAKALEFLERRNLNRPGDWPNHATGEREPNTSRFIRLQSFETFIFPRLFCPRAPVWAWHQIRILSKLKGLLMAASSGRI